MTNRGVTIIGIILVLVIVVVLGGAVLVQTGTVDPSRGSLASLLGGATNVIPIPDIGKVKDVGKKTSNAITGGGGFDFDEETPGYENYQELIQGCPFKDCIPSIDNPMFESVDEADKWLENDDVVFALSYLNLTDKEAIKNVLAPVVRAYPQRILNWHEIVNDEFFGHPVAVTFCPLCGSALAFDRRVEVSSANSGQELLVLEFGVSGKLHNNDLVMYDRETETLWQQITGEAIVGELFGKKLKQVPMSGMRWSQFKEEFPDAEVLSRDTGYSRNYDIYPYGDYEESGQVNFPNEGGVDTTLHPKAVVYGIEVEGNYKAYEEEKLENLGSEKLKDNLGGVELEITYNNGDVEVRRLDSGEELPATRLFWFAWKTFRPDTKLY